MLCMQRRRRPLTSYMSTIQRDIHHDMRAILIDWLVEVALVSMLPPDNRHLKNFALKF